MSRKDELLNEYDQTIDITQPIPPFRDYLERIIDFLIDKIEKLENPIIIIEIPVQKGGDTNGNSKEE